MLNKSMQIRKNHCLLLPHNRQWFSHVSTVAFHSACLRFCAVSIVLLHSAAEYWENTSNSTFISNCNINRKQSSRVFVSSSEIPPILANRTLCGQQSFRIFSDRMYPMRSKRCTFVGRSGIDVLMINRSSNINNMHRYSNDPLVSFTIRMRYSSSGIFGGIIRGVSNGVISYGKYCPL